MSGKNNFRRYNPLLDDWVIVAANRVNRPWQGAKSEGVTFQKSTAVNPLAPGGVRSNGMVTPNYSSTHVFINDFPSFTHFESNEEIKSPDDDLFKEQEIKGVCKVICYHPDSTKTMATLDQNQVVSVVRLWIEEFKSLRMTYKWIQIFENRGAAVGCSNAHPHGQLWASEFLPSLPTRKDKNQKNYYKKHGSVMLMDYLSRELKTKDQPRVVLHNDHWTVLVPFWAFWPYETMLLPNRHVLNIDQITEEEIVSLAAILKQLIIRYDNIFQCTFPYSMGWLGAPTGGSDVNEETNRHWQLHCVFHPPLLRSATVSKFMAGYEVFAELQRDITPEQAAEIIRAQPDTHYSVHEL